MATATDYEIVLYGTVGEDFTDREFTRQLDYARGADEVNVRINSGGGSVTDGLAMHSAIIRARSRGQRVVTWNDGAAFSMAAILFQAGSMRIMADSSLLMLHSPFTDEGGNATELRKMATTLDKVESQLVDIVASRSHQPVEKVRGWLERESWFGAKEALAFGLADKRYTDRNEHAAYATAIFAKYKIPQSYRIRLRQPIEALVANIESDARIACNSHLYGAYRAMGDAASEKAARFLKVQGATADDFERVDNALKMIDEQRYWPREF